MTPTSAAETSPHVIGIDVGTSGVRAVLLDAAGQVLAEARASLSPGDAERRASEHWWQATQQVLMHLGELHSLDAVGALSVDATSGTVLPVDAAGTPIGAAMMYNDIVTDQKILKRIALIAPRNSAVHGASSTLARTLLLQQQGATRILHQADWIAGMLMGRFDLSDESNALKTGYDPVAREWPVWLEDVGVGADLLPQVVAAGTVTGEVSTAMRLTFSLPQRVQVVAGMTDGCASVLATGAQHPGDCVTSLGSTITMKMISSKPLFDPDAGVYSHRIGELWLAGGASNSGGNVLAAFFTEEQLLQLVPRMDATQPTGLAYYPLLQAGERFPHNDASWEPVMEPRPDDDAVFLQAMLEGMARIEANGYTRLVMLGAPGPRSMRTVGGGAKNPVWTALRQHELSVPLHATDSTSAAVGSARLALQAVVGDSRRTTVAPTDA